MPINFTIVLNNIRKITPLDTNFEIKATMEIDNILPFLEVKKPLQILKNISEANIKEFGKNKIIVRVISNSGYATEGLIVKCIDEVSIIQNVKDNSICYLDNKNISSVEIPLSTNVVDVLTSDEYFETPNSVTPSRLELSRNLKDLSEKFTELYRLKISTKLLDDKSLEDKEKHQIKKALEIIEQVILEIAEDHLGKTSLDSLTNITIQSTNSDMAVQKESNELLIHLNLNYKMDKHLRKKLKEGIESSL